MTRMLLTQTHFIMNESVYTTSDGTMKFKKVN